MRRAVIDLGSNTMRMEIYDETDGKMNHIVSAKEVVGMLGYADKGVLSEEGVFRVVEGLQSFRQTASAVGVEKLVCFATAGLRAVRNADEVVRSAKEKAGIEIEVISGEEEARLDFAGAFIPADVSEGLVVDMGGGSTEIVRFVSGHIENCISLPFGSLSLFKRFVKKVLPREDELKKIHNFVEKQLECLDWLPEAGEHVCLIGGTSRAIARLHRDVYDRAEEPLQGYLFRAKDIAGLKQWLLGHTKAGIRQVLRVAPERVHTILPGMEALSLLIEYSGAKTVSLSRSGVREGYIRSKMAKD